MKRDLRIADHALLAESARRDRIAALDVFPPRVHTARGLAGRRATRASRAFHP